MARAIPAFLVLLQFPVRPGSLHPWDRADLGAALEQIGRSIAAGQNRDTGTLVVPYQRRSGMDVKMVVTRPDGRKWWAFNMEYEDLPPEYTMEIAAAGKSFAYWIENLSGQAGSATPAYVCTFEYKATGEETEGFSGRALAVLSGKGTAKNLIFSQVEKAQSAGLELLAQLQQGARREIASGQRK